MSLYSRYLSCKKHRNQHRHVDVCVSLKCSKLKKEGDTITCTYRTLHERRKEMEESMTVSANVVKKQLSIPTENFQLFN